MNNFSRGPNQDFHVVNNPNALLTFLQHDKKVIAKVVDSWPLRINFVIEFTYDSIVTFGGYWMNTIELLEILDLTREFNMLDANLCKISYIQGLSTKDSISKDWYEVEVLFDKVEGDGISFSHN